MSYTDKVYQYRSKYINSSSSVSLTAPKELFDETLPYVLGAVKTDKVKWAEASEAPRYAYAVNIPRYNVNSILEKIKDFLVVKGNKEEEKKFIKGGEDCKKSLKIVNFFVDGVDHKGLEENGTKHACEIISEKFDQGIDLKEAVNCCLTEIEDYLKKNTESGVELKEGDHRNCKSILVNTDLNYVDLIPLPSVGMSILMDDVFRMQFIKKDDGGRFHEVKKVDPDHGGTNRGNVGALASLRKVVNFKIKSAQKNPEVVRAWGRHYGGFDLYITKSLSATIKGTAEDFNGQLLKDRLTKQIKKFYIDIKGQVAKNLDNQSGFLRKLPNSTAFDLKSKNNGMITGSDSEKVELMMDVLKSVIFSDKALQIAESELSRLVKT